MSNKNKISFINLRKMWFINLQLFFPQKKNNTYNILEIRSIVLPLLYKGKHNQVVL